MIVTTSDREDDGEENRDLDGADDMDDGTDPLAQTFLVEEEDGCFLTKIDVFFNKKMTFYQHMWR